MIDLAARTAASVQLVYPQPTPGAAGGPGAAPPAGGATFVPMAETARGLLAAGFGVELWSSRPDYRPYDETEIVSLAALPRGRLPVTLHTAHEAWDAAGLAAEVALAGRLGAEVLVVHDRTLGLPQGTVDWAAVGDLAARARDADVVLALENSGHTGIASLSAAVERLGTDWRTTGLGLCLDVGHAHRSRTIDGHGPAAYLEAFGAMVRELHVHDNFGTDDLHLPPGEGSLDWASLAAGLARLDAGAVVCLELKARPAPLEVLRGARAFLAGLLNS